MRRAEDATGLHDEARGNLVPQPRALAPGTLDLEILGMVQEVQVPVGRGVAARVMFTTRGPALLDYGLDP